MEQLAKLKQLQKITGCLASLSRFISQMGGKCLLLYQLLKKTNKFGWTPKKNTTFRDLKRLLSTAPILAAPSPKEPMLLYIVATNEVVSTILMVERQEEGKAQPVQHPVQYLSEVLSLSKQNYPHYQKLVYGVYMVPKKLKHYFQENPITVDGGIPNGVGQQSLFAIETRDLRQVVRKARGGWRPRSVVRPSRLPKPTWNQPCKPYEVRLYKPPREVFKGIMLSIHPIRTSTPSAGCCTSCTRCH
jgi:hypothetical protein